jgi:DNA-binding PadR family transcriptional regulator
MIEFAIGLFIGALLQWWINRTFFLRVTAAERCILDLLAESSEPMYGLDMVEKSEGLLARGTIYVLLARLEERGLVASYPAGGGRRRYTITCAAPKAP